MHIQHLDELSDNVIIDCGHTKIFWDEFDKIHFKPTESEINTVRDAYKLANLLLRKNKQITINICFCDVNANIKPSSRDIIKKNFERGFLLPVEYNFIREFDIQISLQSTNSNKATNAIKSIKKNIQNENCEIKFDSLYALFLVKNNSTFGFIADILFEYYDKIEENLAKSKITLKESDIYKYPLLRLKQSAFIGLYDKWDGILCPATFFGNIINFNVNNDVILLYSRKDDHQISEKIIGGSFLYKLLNSSNNKIISVVEQINSNKYEIFELKQMKRNCINKVIDFIDKNSNIFSWYKK